MEVLLRKKRTTWKLAIAILVYCIYEVIAVLIGFHIIPYVSNRFWIDAVLVPLSMLTGLGIEIQLEAYIRKKRDPAFGRQRLLGVLYLAPPVAGISGMFASVEFWISALLFSGLMLRLLFLITKK